MKGTIASLFLSLAVCVM